MARSPERCSFTTPRAQLPQHSWHNCHISRGNIESHAESQVQPTIWSGASENTVARSQIATTQLAQLPETYYGSRYWCCFQVLRAPTHPYISDKKSGKNYFPIKEIFSLSPSTPPWRKKTKTMMSEMARSPEPHSSSSARRRRRRWVMTFTQSFGEGIF